MQKNISRFVISRGLLPVFVLLFGVFVSCSRQEERTGLILQRVEATVEQYPDSALSLLETVGNPYELNKAQHARYVLLSVWAKDKARLGRGSGLVHSILTGCTCSQEAK